VKEPVLSVKARIRGFLEGFLSGNALGDDDDMFATGYVNSMFALQLVQFVEGEFGITVDSDDLDLDNFRTISAIAAFVERKLASSPVPG
jgi:methoxymalonate biosynthesis acyl carrier protein